MTIELITIIIIAAAAAIITGTVSLLVKIIGNMLDMRFANMETSMTQKFAIHEKSFETLKAQVSEHEHKVGDLITEFKTLKGEHEAVRCFFQNHREAV